MLTIWRTPSRVVQGTTYTMVLGGRGSHVCPHGLCSLSAHSFSRTVRIQESLLVS